MPINNASSRLHLIEAMRGVAALWVVLFHAWQGGHINTLVASLPAFVATTLFEIGDTGVAVFFVISGFVIAYSFGRVPHSLLDYADFLLRRLVRLGPPYWASIVFALVFLLLAQHVKALPQVVPEWQRLVSHLFYLQDILGFDQINSVYWTLCIEIQFYFSFAVVMAAAVSLEHHFRINRFFTAIVLALISLPWPLGILGGELLSTFFLPYWHMFLLGVFACWAWQQRLSWAFFAAYALVITIGAILQQSVFVLVAVVSAAVLAFAASSNCLDRLNWRPFQFLGLISYSLYLTHNPVSGASFFIANKLLGDSLLSQWLALVMTLLVATGVAWVFWRLFERWSIEMSRTVSVCPLLRDRVIEPYRFR